MERIFEAIAHTRRIVVFDIHVEPPDVGKQEIEDRTVIGQLPPRQYHLIWALFVELALPCASFALSP